MKGDKYIYSHETKSLKQWIEPPNVLKYMVSIDGKREYKKAMEAYAEKLHDLPTIQAEGLNLDKDCELVEGKDFTIEYQILPPVDFPNTWRSATKECYDTFQKTRRRIIALPIHSVDTPSEQQQVSEDADFKKSIEGNYVFDSNKWRATYFGEILLIHKRETISETNKQ